MTSQSPSPLLQAHVQTFVTDLVTRDAKEYKSDLVPFRMHAELVAEEMQLYFDALQEKFSAAKALLQEAFLREEEMDATIGEDARFEAWEKCAAALREKLSQAEFSFMDYVGESSIQKVTHLPDAFMQRAFSFARECFNEARYEEAETVFAFLRFLNPGVFEYWFGEASSSLYRGNVVEAISIYGMCLLLQPKNPLIYYQLACCCYLINEKASCLKAIEICKQYASEQNIDLPYLKNADILAKSCM